ncbi:MAG: hypothetical protein V4463_04940 [Pseudomonadota bacterium]
MADTAYCEHCGQPLPKAPLTATYGEPRTNKVGITITVVLHLLLVLVYLLQPKLDKHAPPANGATMVLLAPLGKPAPKSPPLKRKPVKELPRVDMQRLANTITLPHEKPIEEAPKVEPKPITPPKEVDMSAYIEARRKARGATEATVAAAEDSEAAKADRIAKANIARANGKTHGDDANDTGGIFEIRNQTFHSATVKFRGWNQNFKRRWLTQIEVEQGTEIDVETAIVKKMIELIRKEKTGDFEWESYRLNRVVTMSARVQDTAELQAFLFKEMFPKYIAPRR